jgi:hypothetical protein
VDRGVLAGTVTCGYGRGWTCCRQMACKRSAVRARLLHLFRGKIRTQNRWALLSEGHSEGQDPPEAGRLTSDDAELVPPPQTNSAFATFKRSLAAAKAGFRDPGELHTGCCGARLPRPGQHPARVVRRAAVLDAGHPGAPAGRRLISVASRTPGRSAGKLSAKRSHPSKVRQNCSTTGTTERVRSSDSAGRPSQSAQCSWMTTSARPPRRRSRSKPQGPSAARCRPGAG